ncbi:MAG: DUF3421 domain-containing protein [Gammaproteobacteria bacterium]|nr:DUF3421 domain-containing protein [Gammaproteobacteria bacterium]
MKKILIAIPLYLIFTLAVAAPVSQSPQKNSSAQLLQQMVKLQQTQIALQKQLITLNQQIIVTQQRVLTKTNQTQVKWVAAKNGKSPEKDAFIAGYSSNKPTYICHANHMDGVQPGEMVKNGCLISYAGRAFTEESYEALTSKTKLKWDNPRKSRPFVPRWYGGGPGPAIYPPAKPQPSPYHPVIGGHERGHPIYICRGIYNNKIHVGKQIAGKCNIGFNGQEVKIPIYEVLFLDVD